jgi:hypothetical protein
MPAGPSSVFTIEGDTVVATIGSDLTLEDLERMFRVCEQVEAEYGYFLMLSDAKLLSGLSSEVRRRSAEWGKEHRSGGYATYGSSLLARTVITLLVHGIGLLRKREAPVAFFATEAEAREWLATRRQQLKAGQ